MDFFVCEVVVVMTEAAECLEEDILVNDNDRSRLNPPLALALMADGVTGGMGGMGIPNGRFIKVGEAVLTAATAAEEELEIGS